MLVQLATLVQYRFIMLRRAWFRTTGGQLASVLAAVVILVLLAFGAALGVGMFFLGALLLTKGGSTAILLFVDLLILLVLMAWSVGVMSELQRSDVLDFRRMLYLPVSLRMVFLLNFTASFATPLVPVFALGTLGLSLGLMVGLGPRMLLTLPLAAAFIVMLAAWTYHFRGWLGVLMENKRRRRVILTMIPLIFVVVFQVPGMLTSTLGTRARQDSYDFKNGTVEGANQYIREQEKRNADWMRKAVLAHAAVPPAWLSLGMRAAHERDYGVAFLCFAGMTALGGLGLAAGYRGTHRYYTAATRRRARTKEATPVRAAAGREPLTSRGVPGLSDDTSAVVYASWLTAVRHPTVRMQIVMPFIFGTVFMLPLLMNKGHSSHLMQGNSMIGLVLFMVLASFAVFLFNVFGTDPEGFQALVLLPTPRKRYLLGKNLAFLPIVGLLFGLFAGIAAALMRPEPAILGLFVLQFFQIYLSLCIVGNFLSIL
ncbi:MAG: hypothetical protein RBU21_17500, partial [FCB group bacterium]|nr:hypothetical protein [FCB group bacterium]